MKRKPPITLFIRIENINPYLEQFEGIHDEELAQGIRHELSLKLNELRNELTNRLKARDVVPQIAFDYYVDIMKVADEEITLPYSKQKQKI